MDCQISSFYIYKFHQDRPWTQNRPKRNPSFATFNNLIPTNTLGLLANPLEDGRGTVQMGNTTIRLNTSW